MVDLEVPGKVVEINHRSVHICNVGEKTGQQKLIFLAGSGTTSPYVDFYPLYNLLRNEYEMYVYERPGYGWSEQTRSERKLDLMVDELRLTLRETNCHSPYVLVTHSMAALEGIRYYQRYPEEIQAIIFIDGISPQYAKQFKYTPFKKLMWKTMKVMNLVGVFKVLSRVGGFEKLFVDIEDLPKQLQEVKKYMAFKNMNNATMENELKNMKENGELLLQEDKIYHVPVLIMNATNNGYKNWLHTQQELQSLFVNEKIVTYKNTKHYIHHYKAAEMAREIRFFLQQVE